MNISLVKKHYNAHKKYGHISILMAVNHRYILL